MRDHPEDWSPYKNEGRSGKVIFSIDLSRNREVNAICPGLTDTDILSVMTDELREKVCAGIPMQRIADPVETAKAVLFLVSDDASYITGQALVVDGGMTL